MPTAVLALLAAVGGWWAGYLSARLSSALLEDAERLPSRSSWWNADVLVQGIIAATWGALLLKLGPGWQWATAAILALPLTQVAVTDLRHRYVYTVVAALGMALGLVLSPVVFLSTWWSGALGALTGAAVFALVYGAGRVLYRGQEPLARGDIWIGGMVGAIAGPNAVAGLLLGTLFSGILAVGILVTRRSTQVYMPYGPGLCLGGLAALFLA